MKKKNKRRKKTPHTISLLQAVSVATLERMMIEQIGRDACVLAARLLVDGLSAYRVKSFPLSAALTVDNAAMASLLGTHHRGPRDMKEALEWEAAGAKRIQISYDDDSPAHLIVVANLKKERFLIDLTLNQTERKEHNIPNFGPAIFKMPQKREVDGLAFSLQDCMIRYHFHPGEESNQWFAKSIDWNLPVRTRARHIAHIVKGANELLKMGFKEVDKAWNEF